MPPWHIIGGGHARALFGDLQRYITHGRGWYLAESECVVAGGLWGKSPVYDSAQGDDQAAGGRDNNPRHI